MHYYLAALALGLALSAGSDTHLLQISGDLEAGKSFYQDITNVRAGKKVEVIAGSVTKKGDLDCYLMVRVRGGWGVVARDDDAHGWCSISDIAISTHERLWLLNNGTGTLHYDVAVNQEK